MRVRDALSGQRVGYTDPLGDSAIRTRARALDEFLGDQLGKPWLSISGGFRPPNGDSPSAKSYWEFFLFAVSAAKIASSSSVAEEVDRIFAPPRISKLAKLNSADGRLSLIVVSAHPSIVDDLSSAWHPGWDGAYIYPENHLNQTVQCQITSALDLITQASASAASLVSETCAAICLLGTKGMEAGSCTSLTSKFVPGLIYFTPAPAILTSESIVHESAHLWLSRFESARELYKDPDRKVSSPLRPDPRPISGLVHQVWVLSNLVPYYDSLRELDIPLVFSNLDKIAKRRATHASDLQTGLTTLAENEDALTPVGQNFVSSMMNESDLRCL